MFYIKGVIESLPITSYINCDGIIAMNKTVTIIIFINNQQMSNIPTQLSPHPLSHLH